MPSPAGRGLQDAGDSIFGRIPALQHRRIRVGHLHQRRTGGRVASRCHQLIGSGPAVDGTRSAAVKPWRPGRRSHAGSARRIHQQGTGPGLCSGYLVAVCAHRGRIVSDADRQAVAGRPNGSSDNWLPRRPRAVDSGVGFGQTVGGAQCIGGEIVEYRCAPIHHTRRTTPPRSANGPVIGSRLGRRVRPPALAQQVVGGPVSQCLRIARCAHRWHRHSR